MYRLHYVQCVFYCTMCTLLYSLYSVGTMFTLYCKACTLYNVYSTVQPGLCTIWFLCTIWSLYSLYSTPLCSIIYCSILLPFVSLSNLNLSYWPLFGPLASRLLCNLIHFTTFFFSILPSVQPREKEYRKKTTQLPLPPPSSLKLPSKADCGRTVQAQARLSDNIDSRNNCYQL